MTGYVGDQDIPGRLGTADSQTEPDDRRDSRNAREHGGGDGEPIGLPG
jgi:hypothetical protein